MKIFKLALIGIGLCFFYFCYANTDVFSTNSEQNFKTKDSFTDDHKEQENNSLGEWIERFQTTLSILLANDLPEVYIQEFLDLVKNALSEENIQTVTDEYKKCLITLIKNGLSEETMDHFFKKEEMLLISQVKEILINKISNINTNDTCSLVKNGLSYFCDNSHEEVFIKPVKNLIKNAILFKHEFMILAKDESEECEILILITLKAFQLIMDYCMPGIPNKEKVRIDLLGQTLISLAKNAAQILRTIPNESVSEYFFEDLVEFLRGQIHNVSQDEW